MTNPHPTEDDYARDVARFRAHQAQVLDQLREQTADRPEHRAFLDRLIAAPDDDALWDLAWADHLPKGVGRKVAEALADDVSFARFAEPGRRGTFWSWGGGDYREQRVKDGRAAYERQRSREARERYENSLEGILATALTPRGNRRR